MKREQQEPSPHQELRPLRSLNQPWKPLSLGLHGQDFRADFRKSKPACPELWQRRVEHVAGQQPEWPAPHTFDSKLLIRLQVQGPRKPCVSQAALLTSSSSPLSL